MDIAVADFNSDDVLDIVTAEKGAPNFLYLGLGKTDPTKLGNFSGVTPIPNSNKDGTGVFEYLNVDGGDTREPPAREAS